MTCFWIEKKKWSAKLQFLNKNTDVNSPRFTDPVSAFQRTMVNVILVRAGENCTIPCLVTNPDVTLLALQTCDGRPLPSAMSYWTHHEQGVIIGNASKEFEGCYVCVGQLGADKVTSSQYTVDVLLGNQCPSF